MITHNVDIASFVEGKAEFFTVIVGHPSFWRAIDADALGLNSTEGTEAKIAVSRIVKDNRMCITIPETYLKEFRKLRNDARNLLASFSTNFPFLPKGCFAIPMHNRDALLTKMDEFSFIFNDRVNSLIDNLPSIKVAQRALYEKAAKEVYADKAPAGVSYADFYAKYMNFFDRVFPSAGAIRKSYSFQFRSLGKISRSISLMSREEFLKDEETAAKVKVIAEGEAAMRETLMDWIAETAAACKVGLFKGLYPIIQGIASGESFGKRELNKIQDHVNKVMNLDLFGDKDLAECVNHLKKLTDNIKDKLSAQEKADAQSKVKAAFADVQDAMGKLEFSPTAYARLEIDGDDNLSAIADKEIAAEISERMKAKLVSAIGEFAAAEAKGGDVRAARDKVTALAGVKRKIDDGEFDAAMADAAIRGATLEID